MAAIAEFFGLERRATIENPQYDINDPELWESVGGSMQTEAGITVSPRKGLNLAPVWQAVNLISGDIAKLTLELWEYKDAVGKSQIENHPAAYLVGYQPNREQSAFDFWQQVMTQLLLWNNAYVYIDQSAPGQPRELFPLLPDRTCAKRLKYDEMLKAGISSYQATILDGQLIYETEVDGRTRTFMPSQILHFKGISIETNKACDLVAHARDSWGLALVAEKFASKFFARGGRIGGVLQLPDGMKKDARDKIEGGFRKTYEDADAAFKTVVLRENAKFHAAQQSMQDSQMTEAREAQVRDVARWFNLSPSKLGLSDSVSYNSKAEDNKAHIDSTLGRWLKAIASECWMKLLTDQQKRSLWFFEHYTDDLTRQEPESRFRTHQIAVDTKIKTINEVRAEEGLPPVDWGDEPVEEPAPAAPGQPAAEDPPADDSRSLALRRVLFKLCSRAREKAKSAGAFIEWIDGGLTWHLEDYRTALGDGGAEWLAPYLARLQEAANNCTKDTLPTEIDKLTAQWESEDGTP